MNLRTITPEELARRREAGTLVELIDVRTPVEHAEVHIDGARLVPLDALNPREFATPCEGEPLYVICRSGSRAAKACEKLRAAGLDNVCSVEGGILAWEKAGLPVVRNRKVISLERQVRIAAGMLVVLGILIGSLVHPGFLALSAFVGAGLVFAGVTDTCGMGLLLAKMPWNRQGTCGSACSV